MGDKEVKEWFSKAEKVIELQDMTENAESCGTGEEENSTGGETSQGDGNDR